MTTTNIIVHGASGRMGREVLTLIEADPNLVLVGQLPGEWPQSARSAVVVDFSLPAAMPVLLEQCLRRRIPLVTGTTGLTEQNFDQLRAAAKQIPLLWAANFSLGVAVLQQALRQCAAALPADWDVSLVDTHHQHKLDSPSGTARALAASIDEQRCGRSGAKPVQVVSARIGEVVGDHQVCFAGPAERLELTHRADRRSLFAAGALHAARWLHGQAPGWYSLRHSLGDDAGVDSSH